MRFCFKCAGFWLFSHAALWGAGLGGLAAQATSMVRADRRTGRLVRIVVARPAERADRAADAPVLDIIDQTARRHNLDPLLVRSVIQAESNYNLFAVSPKGAEGLMQLMPFTARRFGVRNSFDFEENIEGGVRYLRHLFDLFGDQRLAVAAYNAGEKAVIRHGGVPPYRETQNYVRLVSQRYAEARQAAPPPAAEAEETEAAKPSEPEYRPIEQSIDQQGNVCFRTR